MTTALEGGEGSASRPAALYPRYPLYRRLGGTQGRSGQVRKISPPPGFDPRTVQPVASRYTDYATRPTHWNERPLIITQRPQLHLLSLKNDYCHSICNFFPAVFCHVWYAQRIVPDSIDQKVYVPVCSLGNQTRSIDKYFINWPLLIRMGQI